MTLLSQPSARARAPRGERLRGPPTPRASSAGGALPVSPVPRVLLVVPTAPQPVPPDRSSSERPCLATWTSEPCEPRAPVRPREGDSPGARSACRRADRRRALTRRPGKRARFCSESRALPTTPVPCGSPCETRQRSPGFPAGRPPVTCAFTPAPFDRDAYDRRTATTSTNLAHPCLVGFRGDPRLSPLASMGPGVSRHRCRFGASHAFSGRASALSAAPSAVEHLWCPSPELSARPAQGRSGGARAETASHRRPVKGHQRSAIRAPSLGQVEVASRGPPPAAPTRGFAATSGCATSEPPGISRRVMGCASPGATDARGLTPPADFCKSDFR